MMTPFMQMRLWWRRGSVAERSTATLAVLIVVGLAAWVLAPTGSDNTTTVASGNSLQNGSGSRAGAGGGGSTAGTTGSGGSAQGGAGTGVAGGSTSGGLVGGTGGAGSSGGAVSSSAGASGGANCLKAPSGTPGVTDTQVNIGVGVLELAGPIGNSAAGVASPEELQRIAEAVIADINARGGVQCRKLVAKYYKGNPISPDQQRATCLQIVQDRPLLFADGGAFVYPAGAYNCLTQQKVPTITPVSITGSDISRFSPYIATMTSDAATAMYTAVFGAKQMGMFDPANGFKKLGLLYEDCNPEFNRAMDAAIAKAGITRDKISKYEFPCPPGGFAPPSQMSQAVIQHRRDGVTHVFMLTGGGSQRPYTQTASSQGFHPKYIFFDYNGMIVTAGQAAGPSGDTIDRALGITTERFGQDTTPGLPVDAGTRRCQALIVKAGLPPDYAYGKQGGGICSLLWTVEAALKGARALTREGALPGLFNAGTVQFSYPFPDTAYRAPSKYYGGDNWWPIEFHKECNCWRVLDANRKPSFTP